MFERRRQNFDVEPVQHLKVFNTWTLQNGQVFQVFQMFQVLNLFLSDKILMLNRFNTWNWF